MPATLQIPLDIPDIRLLSTGRSEQGELIVQVESLKQTMACRRCGRDLKRVHGLDRAIRLRHLPILEQPVVIEIKPKRFQCRDCEGWPTTTQRLDGYDENSPHTSAFDRWLLKMLIGSTVTDVSRRCGVGYDAVDGALRRGVSTVVDWARCGPVGVIGGLWMRHSVNPYWPYFAMPLRCSRRMCYAIN